MRGCGRILKGFVPIFVGDGFSFLLRFFDRDLNRPKAAPRDPPGIVERFPGILLRWPHPRLSGRTTK